MGIVYEAEQLSLQRRVALKVLPFASVLDERQLQRFRNEARAVAGLHHPNIVPVYSVGCERGVHYYAMQQVHGQPLSQLIAAISFRSNSKRSETRQEFRYTDDGANQGAESLDDFRYHQETERNAADTLFDTSSRDWFRRVATIGKQVADALDYAHGVAIVHRDIKPSNLLLDETGKVWVADFGLAQVDSEAELTMTGELIGTLRYMSPESGQTLPHGWRTRGRPAAISRQPADSGSPSNNRRSILRVVSSQPETTLGGDDSVRDHRGRFHYQRLAHRKRSRQNGGGTR